jgi:hypothetical protein
MKAGKLDEANASNALKKEVTEEINRIEGEQKGESKSIPLGPPQGRFEITYDSGNVRTIVIKGNSLIAEKFQSGSWVTTGAALGIKSGTFRRLANGDFSLLYDNGETEVWAIGKNAVTVKAVKNGVPTGVTGTVKSIDAGGKK